ncbi:MAG: hypothetical protein Q7S49_00315 [bacterium]|nr:hypothetical protein [bacterium]
MKKIIVIIIILGAVVLLYMMRDKSPAKEVRTPQVNDNGVFRPDPSSATFIFDDGPITLSTGRNEDASGEETILLNKFAYGDINADDKEDTVLLLARYGAGSGTFIYMGVYVSGPVTYRGSKVTFIGDRIAPQSISINGEIVTIEYLDRRPDEALTAEPTVLISRQFTYRAGEFEER